MAATASVEMLAPSARSAAVKLSALPASTMAVFATVGSSICIPPNRPSRQILPFGTASAMPPSVGATRSTLTPSPARR